MASTIGETSCVVKKINKVRFMDVAAVQRFPCEGGSLRKYRYELTPGVRLTRKRTSVNLQSAASPWPSNCRTARPLPTCYSNKLVKQRQAWPAPPGAPSWPTATRCYYFSRNANGKIEPEKKTPYDMRHDSVHGQILPFGVFLSRRPAERAIAMSKKFDGKVLTGIFMGYHLLAGPGAR